MLVELYKVPSSDFCAQLHLIAFAYQLDPGEYADVSTNLVCQAANERKFGLHWVEPITEDEFLWEINCYNLVRPNNTIMFIPHLQVGVIRISKSTFPEGDNDGENWTN